MARSHFCCRLESGGTVVVVCLGVETSDTLWLRLGRPYPQVRLRSLSDSKKGFHRKAGGGFSVENVVVARS